MSVTTRSRTQKRAREAATRFTDVLVERFGDSVRSVVLYGSAGRGESTESSDVDVLVLAEASHPDRKDVVDVADSVDYDNEYTSYVVPIIMTPGKLQGLLMQEFPVARSILSEGVAIHDDGTFKRLCEASSGTGGRNAN